MASIAIQVINRKGDVISKFDSVPANSTVDEFKKLFIKDSDFASKFLSINFSEKRGLCIERLRFTVGDAKGEALADKTK